MRRSCPLCRVRSTEERNSIAQGAALPVRAAKKNAMAPSHPKTLYSSSFCIHILCLLPETGSIFFKDRCFTNHVAWSVLLLGAFHAPKAIYQSTCESWHLPPSRWLSRQVRKAFGLGWFPGRQVSSQGKCAGDEQAGSRQCSWKSWVSPAAANWSKRRWSRFPEAKNNS